MCTKSSLNPKAPEWKPTPKLPPHLILAAPPPHPPPNAEWEEGKKTGSEFGGFGNKKGKRRNLPPRLRVLDLLPEKNHAPPPPPPQKQLVPQLTPSRKVWKPKKSACPDFKVSSDGGSSVSPLPVSPSFSPHSSRTTVMIKNVPNDLRKCFMLKFLDGLCKVHSFEYDFFYLPMDFKSKQNLGYAFVNLTSSDGAEKLKKVLENFRWGVGAGKSKSRKICEITWARIQGKSALLRRFQNANFPCDDSDFLPVVLDPPRDGSDPNPPPPVVVGRLCGRRR